MTGIPVPTVPCTLIGELGTSMPPGQINPAAQRATLFISLRFEFCGATITSDPWLLVNHEMDEAQDYGYKSQLGRAGSS